MSPVDLLPLAVLLVVLAGGATAARALAARPRRRAAVASALAGERGLVGIRSAWNRLEIDLQRPGWRGTLIAHSKGPRAFETITFQGTTTAARGTWSLKSRWLLLPADAGPLHLPDAELDARFAAAGRSEEILSFLDPETARLLLELDAGPSAFLAGRLAGTTVSVQGPEVSVAILGQSGTDESHFANALRLIERAASYSAPPARA